VHGFSQNKLLIGYTTFFGAAKEDKMFRVMLVKLLKILMPLKWHQIALEGVQLALQDP